MKTFAPSENAEALEAVSCTLFTVWSTPDFGHRRGGSVCCPCWRWCCSRRNRVGQAQPTWRPDRIPLDQGKPNPIAADQPGLPVLATIPVPRDRPHFHLSMADASPLPREKRGMSVLDFAYKPLRVKTVDIPGQGRRPVHYLYYKVVNRTGAPRIFAPQFIMVNDKGERFEANVVPEAIPAIQHREDPAIPLLGRTAVKGILPPSTKPNVDDAVYGVATWEEWDNNADRIRIYVRGLSDGHEEIPSPSGGKAVGEVQDPQDRLHPQGEAPAHGSAARMGPLVSEARERRQVRDATDADCQLATRVDRGSCRRGNGDRDLPNSSTTRDRTAIRVRSQAGPRATRGRKSRSQRDPRPFSRPIPGCECSSGRLDSGGSRSIRRASPALRPRHGV